MEEYLDSKWRQATSTLAFCYLAFCYLAYFLGQAVGNALSVHWGYWLLAIAFGALTVVEAILYGREFERYRLNK